MSELQISSVRSAPHGGSKELDRLRETTGQIVGSLFYGTLLKSMRDSELKGEYGHGGRGEEVFSAQLHGVFAERLGAASSRHGLADVLYGAFEKQTELISQARNASEPRVNDVI